MVPYSLNTDPDQAFLSFFIRNGLQEKPSVLKREHPALKKIKFINFVLFLVVALLDPDTDLGTPLNPDPIGSVSKTLIK